MKNRRKRLSSAAIAVAMILSVLPAGSFVSAAAAGAQSNYTPGDIITFGSYPQSKVTDDALKTALNSQTLGADNTVTYNGSRYLRVYFTVGTNTDQSTNGYYINTVYWFRFDPVQWRVLSAADGELFVLSEKILAARQYNQVKTFITWEGCTLRTWLNNDFYNMAFDLTQRGKIKTSSLVNADNPWNGTDGGNDTSDKVFLLAFADVMNSAFGYNTLSTVQDPARRASGTDYAKCNGLYVSTNVNYPGTSRWWLRSPGNEQTACGFIYTSGEVGYFFYTVEGKNTGIRPALKISLKDEIFSAVANSGCVIDYDLMTLCGIPPETSSLAGYAAAASGYDYFCVPTADGFGTGTAVQVNIDGTIVDTYTVLIYGDVNGDGSVDSIDAGKIVDYENYLILLNSIGLKAADLNGDGNADSMDAGIVVDAENYMVAIDQTTGLVAG